jgi:Raf kinase inhibitor-like YbhB/YbcL family protein
MKLTSSAFKNGQKIPSRYTCNGENLSPPLGIADVPEGTRSLALIMEDPDVPKNIRKDGMWDHWMVFNMPPDLSEIQEATEPRGTAGKGTNGEAGYFGPCPPDREHRYFIKLFALDTKLELPAKSTKADVEKAMDGHILAQTELMGLCAPS